MRWYINDLSLQGQFPSQLSFEVALTDVLRLRRFPFIKDRLFCSRSEFPKRLVTTSHTVADALRSSPNKDFRALALSWIDKYGPHFEDDQLFEADDYFEFSGEVVTYLALGEAARRNKAGDRSSMYSFSGGAVDYSSPELIVSQGLPEERLAIVPIPNVIRCDELVARAISALSKLSSYDEMLSRYRIIFPRLCISRDIDVFLSQTTFYPTIADGAYDLLDILDQMMEQQSPIGLTDRGVQLFQQYFNGTNAWFTDESRGNKVDFQSAMTFRDPLNRNSFLLCYWHGKIQTPQFRVHFEWPVPKGQRLMKIVYIGPKISKK